MPVRLSAKLDSTPAEWHVLQLQEVGQETAQGWEEQLWKLATAGDSSLTSAADIKNLFCMASRGSGIAGAGPDSKDYLDDARAGDGQRTDAKGEFLPTDILERIQACLPAVNFFQSRLVSKNWHQSLRSPGTRGMHAALAPQEQWLLAFAYSSRLEVSDSLPPPYAYDLRTKKWHRLPMDCVCPNGVVGNFAVGGGLLCFEESRERVQLREYPRWSSRNIVICNPLNGSRKRLPVPSVAAESELRVVGFVRNDITEDYKLYGICVAELPLLASLVVYDSRTDDWTVTGTSDTQYNDQIERSVVWRKSLWLIRRSLENGDEMVYQLFSCKLDEGVWRRVAVTIPDECLRACPDLAVYKDRLMIVGIVDGDPDLHHPEAGRGKIWELKEEADQWNVVPVAVVPSYFTDHWRPEACFVGLDDLLYIQLSEHTSRIVVCDLSKQPASWWLLPPCPTTGYPYDCELSYFTMPVTPRLDAFVV